MHVPILIWHRSVGRLPLHTLAYAVATLTLLHRHAQRPTFTPLWAAGLSLGPVKVGSLAGGNADGAPLSTGELNHHFANPGAMPILPDDECEAARHLHGRAGNDKAYTPYETLALGRHGVVRRPAARFQSVHLSETVGPREHALNCPRAPRKCCPGSCDECTASGGRCGMCNSYSHHHLHPPPPPGPNLALDKPS